LARMPPTHRILTFHAWSLGSSRRCRIPAAPPIRPLPRFRRVAYGRGSPSANGFGSLLPVLLRVAATVGTSCLTLLPGRVQDALDGFCESLPSRTFGGQMLFPGGGQAIGLAPLIVLGDLPLRADPLLPLQPVQRRIERAGVYLQRLVGIASDRLADAVAMLWPPLQRLQDEHVQRPLQQLDPVLVSRFHLRFPP